MAPRRAPPRRAKRLLAMAAAVAALAALAGCGAAARSEQGSTTVVAAFYPWAYLSRQILGDVGSVQNLTAPGTDPHDLELTARQVVEVSRADLVVYVQGMQPAVDDAVERHAADHAMDAGSVVDGLAGPDEGEPALADDHKRAAARKAAERGVDPHVWLDPVRFAAVAKELGNRLAHIDPAHAEGYLQRTERVVRNLDQLHEAYRSGLRDCRTRTIVTSHVSFAYIADRYDLEQVGVAGLDPHVPPSPARLAEVARLVQDKGIEVIFLDRLANTKAATSVAREVGARTAVLDPISGISPDSSEDYLSLMRDNLSTLRDALGCS